MKMKINIQHILNNSFVRNVVIMATGTAAAQAVSLLLSPIITRIYGPEAYGVMGVFMAIVGIITPIAALTFPVAIVLPKSDENAKGIIRLSLYITMGISTTLAICLLLFHEQIVRLFHIEDVSSFLYLLPMVVLFAGVLQVTEQWLIRKKQFVITAKVGFIQSLLLQGSKVGIGIFYPLASVLVFISAIGNGMKASLMLLLLKRSNNRNSHEPYDEKLSIKQLAKKHRDFPIFRAPQSFISAVSESLPVLVLSSLFGPASAGLYSIGRTVLSLPTRLIGKAVGDVFYPRVNDASKNGEELTKLIAKATLYLGIIGIIPFGLVFTFGPSLFGLVFGEEWIKAGEYARWISLWLFTILVYQPCIKAFPVMNAQSFHLIFTVLTLIIQVSALSVGYYVFSKDMVSVALLGISSAVVNVVLIIITLKKSHEYDLLRARAEKDYQKE